MSKWKVTQINDEFGGEYNLPSGLHETAEAALDAARVEIMEAASNLDGPGDSEEPTSLGFSCTASRTDGQQSCWANVVCEWNEQDEEWELELLGEHSANGGIHNYCSALDLERLGDDLDGDVEEHEP